MAYRSFGANFEIPIGNLPHGDGYTVGPTGSNADYITDGVADEVQINQAITDAFNSGFVTTVKLSMGTYSVSDTITMRAGIHLMGEQAGSVKITAATNFNYAGTSSVITAVGTETTSIPINLNVNLVDGYNIIQVSTVGSSGTEYGLVSNGDYLFLVANSIWDANSEQSIRYTGEYVKVSTKSANSFTIHGMTRSNYNTTDSARLYRMSFLNNITIENIEITQSSPIKTIPNAGNCILLQKTYNAVVKNCILHDFDGTAVGLWNAVKTGIYHNQIYNLTDDTVDGYFGYGIICGGASEQIIVAENNFDYIRHALTTGYPVKVSATLDGYGISRNVNFVGNTITHANNSAIDTHAQSDGINISNNSISSCITYGVFTRGIGTHIMNNDIEWCGAGISVGISPQISGGSGSGAMVVGNTIKHITFLSASTTNGIISGSGVGINLTQTDNVIVSGNTIDGCDAQGIFLNVYAKNCVIQDNIIMNANLLNAANIGAIGLGGSGAGTGTLAFSTPTVTLTTTGSPFNTNYFAGQIVKITGAANAGNNGTFTITAVPTANTIQWSNASGVAGDTVTFVIENVSDCYIVNNTAINTPVSRFDATVTGHAKYLVFDSGLTGAGGNVRNTFKSNTGFNMESGLINSQNATSFFAGNSSNESTPIKSITSAADDGYFQSVPQAGTMAINTATGASYIRTNTTNVYNELVTVGTDLLTSPIRFDKSISLPTISQTTNTTNGATATDLLIAAQIASGTTSTGGSLQLRAGTGIGANGQISMRAGGNTFMNFLPGGTSTGVGATQVQISGNATSFTLSHVVNGATTTNGAVFLVQAQGTGSFADGYTGGTLRLSPGTTSSPTNGTGGSMLLDAPFGLGSGTNGTIQIRSSTTTVFTISPSLTVASPTGIAQIQVAAANAGFNLNQADKTTNGGTAANFTIQAQNETGTTSTGGDLILVSGTGTTTAGNVTFKAGATTVAQVTPNKLISSKGRRHNITTITGTYQVLTTDEYVIVTTNAAAFTITLPASPTTGDTYEIKDGVGNAAAKNLTIAGNGKTIDGATNYILNINYGAVLVAYNGIEWSIL